MLIKDGRGFMENVVMQYRADCTHCGHSFSFLEAGLTARQQGIKDSVIDIFVDEHGDRWEGQAEN